MGALPDEVPVKKSESVDTWLAFARQADAILNLARRITDAKAKAEIDESANDPNWQLVKIDVPDELLMMTDLIPGHGPIQPDPAKLTNVFWRPKCLVILRRMSRSHTQFSTVSGAIAGVITA